MKTTANRKTATKATPYIPTMTKMQVTEEAVGAFQTMGHHLLVAILEGRVDAKRLAASTLAGRGFDKEGCWIGFDAAAKLYA